MIRKLVFILLFMVIVVPVFADNIFDDSLFYESGYRTYLRAIELNDNDAGSLEAYGLILNAQHELDSRMQICGKTPAALTEDEFRIYWPVKVSVAEIAYKLGLHTVMAVIVDELDSVLRLRNIDSSDAVVQGWLAQLAKIIGCRHLLLSEYEASEADFLRALSLYPSPTSSFVVAVHEDLAQLYYMQGLYEKALQQIDMLLQDATLSGRYRFDNTKIILELKGHRALCSARIGRFDEAVSAIDTLLVACKQANLSRLYAETLRKKAKILMLSYNSTGVFNPTAQECYRQYLSFSRKYVDDNFIDMSESEREQYWMAEKPFVTDCYRLEGNDPALLYDVALYGKAVLLQMGRRFKPEMSRQERQQVLASIRLTWRDVQKHLPDTAAAIEYIVYEKSGEEYVAALVLHKNDKSPVFVPIAKMSEIVDWRLPGGMSVGEALKHLGSQSAINDIYSDSLLAYLIWNKRLVNTIGAAKTVFFAPDGLFHLLAVEYLIPESIRDRKFVRLTSTRLLAEHRSRLRGNNMLMLGGIDYDAVVDTLPGNGGNDALAYSLLASKSPRFGNLYYSRGEVDSVSALRSNPSDLVLHADSATEAVVKSLIDKYQIVLISTHGYFDEASTLGTDLRPANADMQLSHSGILLSGAMKNLSDKNFDVTQPDGILSAREISAMDLSHVDLVVLSACMSGLGYITPDGVFGLQRGLKTAGVCAVLASLWEVDDASSSLLIRYLYANLENGMSLHDAFQSARQTLRSTVVVKRRFGLYRRSTPFDQPYYYNAFILIDGIE